MPSTASDLKDLQDRVVKLESTLRSLKLLAGLLGISGVVLGGFLTSAFTKASAATTAAEQARQMAETVPAKLTTAANEALNTIKTAEQSAAVNLQSHFVSSSLVPELSWSTGQPPTPLGVKVGEGFCFLTRITGDFDGGGEVVQIAESDGRFLLKGPSNHWVADGKGGTYFSGHVICAQAVNFRHRAEASRVDTIGL